MIKENRVSKYMLYAIGEIILVVIGILIALQINNWNEEKKINKSIENHLAILKQNLSEDFEQLKELNQNMVDNTNRSDSLMMQMKTLIPIDNYTSKYIVTLLLEYQFRPNTNAMETMTQSNEIPFLKTELQTAILDYYALIKSAQEREQISNTQIQSKYEVYINKNYPSIFQRNNEWEFLKNYYKDDPRPLSFINEKDFLADKTLESLITSRYFQSVALKKFYSDLLDASSNILKML
ncbi:MAG: hypothetical protein DA407_05470 [Bacteroidetes bacterium]|nr:MAG: hypothetical protein DA407_05470 [Bacteroidota bacterium]